MRLVLLSLLLVGCAEIQTKDRAPISIEQCRTLVKTMVLNQDFFIPDSIEVDGVELKMTPECKSLIEREMTK